MQEPPPHAQQSPAFTAAAADRHQLYELAVQQPVLMTGFLVDVYTQFNEGEEPLVLREDFAGTANLAATWVCRGEECRAIAVDDDADVLAWADRHNRRPLGDAGRRLKLTHRDVRRCHAKADVLVSLNFSHFIWHDRADLLAYLRHARRCLQPGGLMVLDTYGGPGALETGTDERDHGDFTYQWEQASFDPTRNRVVNHIHFAFPDGARIDRAFTYNWRLWSLAELHEALLEAGFDDPHVCFETEDGFGDLDPEQMHAWVAYIIAGANK